MKITDFRDSTSISEIGLGTTVGGDLSGSITAPTVVAINGVVVSGVPTVNQEIVALTATTASWQTPAGGRTFTFFGG